MPISHEAMKTINRLRREQGVLSSGSWKEVYAHADPGLHGLLRACQSQRVAPPEVAYPVYPGQVHTASHLELAWPRSRVGVAIGRQDREKAQKAGWRVWSMFNALEQMPSFVAQIAR